MQTLKSILLHLDGSSRCVERVRVAQQLAKTFDAEVTGLYCVTPGMLRYAIAAPASAVIAGDFATLDQEDHDRAQADYRAACAGSPLMSWDSTKGNAPWEFSKHAMYCDLMVMGQRDPGDPKSDETQPDFVPSMLIESGKPALVLPYAGSIPPIGQTVLIAWKETRESAHAVSAALPWLCRARQVHVICYDKSAGEALANLQRHLLRHGVATKLHHGVQEHVNAGEQLLSKASDLGADLLVMGCYGHSRAREWALGGATRTILETMTLPVLMAH